MASNVLLIAPASKLTVSPGLSVTPLIVAFAVPTLEKDADLFPAVTVPLVVGLRMFVVLAAPAVTTVSLQQL